MLIISELAEARNFGGDTSRADKLSEKAEAAEQGQVIDDQITQIVILKTIRVSRIKCSKEKFCLNGDAHHYLRQISRDSIKYSQSLLRFARLIRFALKIPIV